MSPSGTFYHTMLPTRGWYSPPVSTLDDVPKLTTATFIGIMIAITGNVLISLALNLQKLAHKRVGARAQHKRNNDQGNGKNTGRSNVRPEPLNARLSEEPSLDENEEDRFQAASPGLDAQPNLHVETQSLIPFPGSQTPRNYGSGSTTSLNPSPNIRSTPKSRTFFSRLVPFRLGSKKASGSIEAASLLPVDVISEEAALNGRSAGQKVASNMKPDALEVSNETDYLKSKIWWLGFILMNVGEMGNFISYAWAPASVVAPLGTFALMANCVFAPLMLNERFRKRDLLGILIAIIGAVTVVLASNASDVRLDPDSLVRAICQTPFIIYSAIYIGGAILLAMLSHGSVGRRWVFVDVGLCALFGGFTVLSTKAISTLLTMDMIEMFRQWITYPILAVLALTGVGQIRYLNRALMRFDSKVVIPVQFVLFTLSAIIGSAILYGDFKTAKFHQIVTFLYGCAATFLGVFIIAWAPASSGEDGDGSANNASLANGHSPAANEDTRFDIGTIGRRRRATLILPSGVQESPIVRSQQNSMSLIGLSPAQHLLLVHTPPREVPIVAPRFRDGDTERGQWTPDSEHRRRTISWLDDSTRDRTRSSVGTRVGSLDRSVR